jgi:signal transduction histidine kinase
MQHLFEPSFSQKGMRVKSGMGLFISYNIIQKHNGEIKVESEVGKGSKFTIILPADAEKESKVHEMTKSRALAT